MPKDLDNISLAHTCWNCKYHIVFAPKYRRKEFYGLKRLEIGAILRRLCEWKGITIHEAEVCPDHVHMLISVPPKFSVSGIMGYLKGKSSLMIYQKWGNAKFKYRNREFWCRGYYVDTVGKNTKKIEEYIRNQLREDQMAVQLTIDFDGDPFNGQPVANAGVGSFPAATLGGGWQQRAILPENAKPPDCLVDNY